MVCTLIAACGGEVRAPTEFGDHDVTPVGGGRGSTQSPVIGAWQVVIVIQTPDDFQTWTTVWRFDAAGPCRFTRTVHSVALGGPVVTDRACTFTPSAFPLSVTFTDTGATQHLAFSFPASSRDRMTLEGLVYERIG